MPRQSGTNKKNTPKACISSRRIFQWNRALHDEIQASPDEIFSLRLQMKSNPPFLFRRSRISSRSDFTHHGWISSAIGGFNWKKHLQMQVLFSGGRWWIRTTEAKTQQIYSLPPLATREISLIKSPRLCGLFGAGDRSRTINLLITNQLLCHWATPA